MELITGRKGKSHITPALDAMWHMGIIEGENCIFNYFEKFKADIISNNEVRVRSGVGQLQGRYFAIPENTYDSAVINNGTQDENRIDLIVCRITVDNENNTQNAETIVIQGTPTTDTPVAPEPIIGDLDNGDLVADYPLHTVRLEGINITSVTPLFSTGWIISDETIAKFAAANMPIA